MTAVSGSTRPWPTRSFGKPNAPGHEPATPNNASTSCLKPHPRRPAPTLPKTQTGRGFATVVHPTEPRALSIAEAKIICSFPDSFQLVGAYSQQWARLGNSVPPLLMRAVAEHVRDAGWSIRQEQDRCLRARIDRPPPRQQDDSDHGHDVRRERALMVRATASEGSVLTSDEREQVYAAIIRAARSAQRRQAAADAAAVAEQTPTVGSVA